MTSRHGKRFWEKIPTLAMFTTFALIFSLIVVGVIYMARTGQQAQDSLQPAQAKAAQGEQLADKVKIACDNQDVVAQLRALGACQDAQAIKSSPPVAPSDAQVASAVETYLRDHPPSAGRSVTPGDVAAAVAKYLTDHPPTPGRPPTAEEIQTATMTYLVAHPDQFKGKPGDNATTAMVAAAVAAYCTSTTPGPCTGPAGPSGVNGKDGQNGKDAKDGAQGAQGTSVQDLYFERDSGGACQVVVVLYNPATNTQSTIRHSAGEPACSGGGTPTPTPAPSSNPPPTTQKQPPSLVGPG